MKKLYELTMSDNSKKKILANDYGTHVSLTDIGLENDINYIFGKTLLVTSKPSTIEDELEYYINNSFKYSSQKVEEYKLLETQL